jgi:hypothetical protein
MRSLTDPGWDTSDACEARSQERPSAWFYTDQLGRDDWSGKVDVIVSR